MCSGFPRRARQTKPINIFCYRFVFVDRLGDGKRDTALFAKTPVAMLHEFGDIAFGKQAINLKRDKIRARLPYFSIIS